MLYSIVLVPYSIMNQPLIYICSLPLEPSSHLPPHPIPLGCHRAPGLSSPHHTANSHWLSILRGVMYMFQCYSLSLFHPLLPPLCPQVFSLCLHLCSCPANRFISVIFLGFVYTHGFIQWFCWFWFCFFVPERLSAPWDW